MHYTSMASRDREQKGSRRGSKETNMKPHGSQRGATRELNWSQKGAQMKNAPPKAPFAEQERTGLEANMMPMYAKRVPKRSQHRCQESLKNHEKTGNGTNHENHET